MPHSPEIKAKLLAFIEMLAIYIEKTVFFKEAICTDKDNFDKYFTTFSSMEFILLNFSARLSGVSLLFDGGKLTYEIGLDYIIQFEERENEFEFLEAYSEKIYRKTILKIDFMN